MIILYLINIFITVSRARASFRESFRLKGGRKPGGTVDRNGGGSGRVSGRRRQGPSGMVQESMEKKHETIIEESEDKDLEK